MGKNTNDAIIHNGMEDEEYFALPSLDQSQLKQYLASPFEWAWNRLHHERKETDALRFGSAFHAYLLGTQQVVSLPEGETFQKKANREWRDKQIDAGNIVVSSTEMSMIEHMRENLAMSSQLGERDFLRMIEEGTREQALEWTDRKSGLRLKAKADLIPTGDSYLVDLKTCRSINPDELSRSFIDHGYHIQAEFYRKAVSQFDPKEFKRQKRRANGMEFWCFEKSESARWAPYTIPTDSPVAEIARDAIETGLNHMSITVAEAQDNGYGEGYDAAARMILDRDYPNDPHEMLFSDWQLKQAASFHSVLMSEAV